MEVPGIEKEQWENIVTGRKRYQLKFLATKILLGRLTRSVKEDSSPDNIRSNASQLRNMFVHNIVMPSVQEDLKTIFGEDV